MVDDLANEFAKLRASVANLAAKFDPNAEPQQYGNPTTTPHRTNQVNQQPRDLSNQRCYKCHEPGHFAAQCQSEACRIPENQGYPTKCHQAHVANYFEDSDGEEEPDFWPEVVEAMTNPMEAYPAIHRNEVSPTRRNPYNPKAQRAPTPEPPKTIKRTPTPGPSPKPEDMEEDEEPPIKSESSKEQALKGIKDFGFDAWGLMKNSKVEITWADFLKMSNEAQCQIKAGILSNKPAFIPRGVNNANMDDLTTSAYTNCYIGQYAFKAIVDTGAGPSIISKAAIDRMGWEIDAATTTTLIMADGADASPVGKMLEVIITIGKVQIAVDMEVVKTLSYEVLLGMDYLTKSKAIMHMGEAKMFIESKGIKEEVQLDTHKMSRSGRIAIRTNVLTTIRTEEASSAHQQQLPSSQMDWQLFANMHNQRCKESDYPLEVEHSQSGYPYLQFGRKLNTNDQYLARTDEIFEQFPQTQGWSKIEQPIINETEGWPGIEESRTNLTEWDAIPEHTNRPITISQEDDSKTSPAARRQNENFKKTRCPHGTRFFSPEDECFQCTQETFEENEAWHQQ